MMHDKKAKEGKLTFILVKGIGRAFVTDDVPMDAVLNLLAA
jgi:3-dehydroquinate synthetase